MSDIISLPDHVGRHNQATRPPRGPLVFTVAFHSAAANYENVRDLEPRARFGSLTVMKRHMCRRRRHLLGIQPLHFSRQP